MKNLKGLLVIGLLVLVFAANAQFKVGVGGGVNLSNLAGSDISGTENRLGFNGGVLLEAKFPIKLGFELDVLFSTKGTKDIIFKDNRGNIIGTTGIKFSYIDMPLVMKIYTAKILSFQVGAQYSLLVSSNSSGIYSDDKWKNGDMAAVVGLGVDALKFHLAARYNYGLTSIDEAGADIKNNMLTLSVGYWIK